MYRHHFGLNQHPLGKQGGILYDSGQLAVLKERFDWLLHSPGIGLLTGHPGVGKTAAMRALTASLNPHQYQVIYLAETDFGRLDIYRSLALAIGLEPPHRRAALWREIKARLMELADQKHLLPVWIIDEAQNLPSDFFRDFPAFLNFAFDSRDLMTVWLLAHPCLAKILDRALYEPMASRIQVRAHLHPIEQRDAFQALIKHALEQAGCTQRLISDSGMEMLRQASAGKPRQAGQVLRAAMKMAVPKGLNHLPDELIQQAIEVLKCSA